MARKGTDERPENEGETSFVSNYLSALLAQASYLFSSQFHTHLKRFGISVPTWRVLAILSDGQGKPIGEIARIGLYNQPTTSKIIDRLTAEGLVQRRQDEADKRKMLVFITSKGQELVRTLMDDAIEHEKRSLEGYSPEEVALLKNVLRTLISRLEKA